MNPADPSPTPRRVYWAFLLERAIYDRSADVLSKVSFAFGRASALQPERGWYPIYAFQDDFSENTWQYMRTDVARQALAMAFQARAKNPHDTLIMFDIDHKHPVETALRLLENDVEVCVPLMFRRGEPFQACAFRRQPGGDIYHLANYPPGLWKMDGVGSGMIAIQRRALDKIIEAGLGPFFFKYRYGDGTNELPPLSMPSEDMFFSLQCEKAGVGMWVDTRLETPHLDISIIDKQTNLDYQADHPEIRGTGLVLGVKGDAGDPPGKFLDGVPQPSELPAAILDGGPPALPGLDGLVLS